MQHKLLHDSGGQRTFAVVLQTGDEAMDCLRRFAQEARLEAAQITGIGAFEKVILRYFDWGDREYLDNPIDEQVEVASLIGDVALAPNGKPSIHVHLVVGKRNGAAFAGHLGSGHVRPTLELIVTESPAHLRKVHDPVSGLALIRLKE